jgi:hypothetical protein
MKLTDLDTSRRNNAYKALKEHYELPFNVDKMAIAPTRAMLQKVRGLMTESKQSPDFYESQTNPAYMKLVFMEQALADHFAELRLQPQPRIVVENEEVEKSQVVLAAQDLVDSVQKMLEDVGQMKVKELPALVAGIESEIGVTESQAYNEQVTAQLDTLTTTLNDAYTAMKAALNQVTGQAGGEEFAAGEELGADAGVAAGEELGAEAGAMGAEAGAMGAEAGAPELPPEEPELPATGGVGRAKR